MKHLFFWMIAAILTIFVAQCDSKTKNNSNAPARDSVVTITRVDTVVIFAGKSSKGFGKFKDVQLAHPLDQGMVATGNTIFQSKCYTCHKLTKEVLVGPGWYGVTQRRTPEWIMNWITNTKVMLDKDLAAQTELVVCQIRMPKQELNDAEARNVLEFMRKNDGDK
jgi:hypothetical protein